MSTHSADVHSKAIEATSAGPSIGLTLYKVRTRALFTFTRHHHPSHTPPGPTCPFHQHVLRRMVRLPSRSRHGRPHASLQLPPGNTHSPRRRPPPTISGLPPGNPWSPRLQPLQNIKNHPGAPSPPRRRRDINNMRPPPPPTQILPPPEPPTHNQTFRSLGLPLFQKRQPASPPLSNRQLHFHSLRQAAHHHRPPRPHLLPHLPLHLWLLQGQRQAHCRPQLHPTRCPP